MGGIRCSVASITAFQGSIPDFRKSSICTTRIREFRIRMPIKARIPRIATKPSGAPLETKAVTTPIRPNGATSTTRNARWKLCIWIMIIVAMAISIIGTTAIIGPWPFALSSTAPPVSIWNPEGRESFNFVISGAKRETMVAGCVEPMMLAFTVIVGRRLRRQMVGASDS